MRVFCEIIHIITLASMVSVATADCCKSSSTCSAWEVLIGKDCPPNCDDGSNPTPCCGYGNCNAFCCACDGGRFPTLEFFNTLFSVINVTRLRTNNI